MSDSPQPAASVLDRLPRVPAWVLFGAGGLWDWLTLRVDRIADYALLSGYLGVFGALLLLELRANGGFLEDPRADRLRRILGWSEPFLLGALLSAFLIHVLRAIHPGPAVVFAVILCGLVVANEWFPGLLRETAVRAGIFTFCTFQLLATSLPLLTGALVSAVVPFAGATLLCMVLVLGARYRSVRPPDPMGAIAAPLASSLLFGLGLIGAIRAGLLPPLPLSLHQGVLADDVHWEDETLVVDAKPLSWAERLGVRTPELAISEKRGLTLLSAIGAPQGMLFDVIHEWQWLDPADQSWKTSDRIDLDVKGGGSATGFRTWSTKKNLRSGSWRVRVLTVHDQELGRVRFDIP